MKVSEVMGANGQVVCDCGKVDFHVLMRVEPNGNNHIVALRCAACAKEMPVPFQQGGEPVGLNQYRKAAANG